MPAIDFGDVKDLVPVPAGSYPATIVKAEDGVSNNGNPKIDIQWKLETGVEGTDGRIIFEPLTFTDKTLWRVKRTLLALGFDNDFSGEVTGDMLVGKSAEITVDIQPSTQVDPDTGRPYPDRNRVKNVRPLD